MSTAKKLADMSVAELEAMVNALDQEKQSIREKQKLVQVEISSRTSKNKFAHIVGGLNPDEVRGLHQYISDAGNIKAGVVGTPGK